MVTMMDGGGKNPHIVPVPAHSVLEVHACKEKAKVHCTLAVRWRAGFGNALRQILPLMLWVHRMQSPAMR
jgi:hypothetical protein